MSVRRLVWGAPVLAAIALVAVAGARGPAATRGVATRVVDGDTFVVRLPSSRLLRVRLAGVAAPSGKDCGAATATRRLRALVLRKTVTLTGAGNGRWFASARGTPDVGRALLADGIVQVDAWGPGFARFPDYAQTDQLAQSNRRGVWKACSADLAATVQPAKGLFPTNSNASFGVTVTNSGTLAAPGVTLDLRPPAGSSFLSVQPATGTCTLQGYHATCALGTVAPKASLKVDTVVTTGGSGVIATRAFVKFGWCVRYPCGATPVSDANRQNDVSGGFAAVGDPGQPLPVLCDPSYPTLCIPPPPPRLECNDIPYKNFQVLHDTPSSDPQHLDNNFDNVGCTFDDY
jgi:endonuclease YncB( thermonuclease family)